MAQTKKFAVAFDENRPESPSSDFLVPMNSSGKLEFFGITSRRTTTLGLIVYIGKEISESDIIARMSALGRDLQSMENCALELASYIEKLKTVRIGNIVRLTGVDAGTLSLEVVSKSPSEFQRIVRHNK